MQVERIKLNDGVNLTYIPTDKFKTNLLTVNLFVPLDKKTASHYSVITDILRRGTRSYPSMRELNLRSDELYSTSVSSGVQSKGEAQIISFSLSSINDEYTFDNSDIFRSGLSLLGEYIFRPLTEDGEFLGAYFEQERKNLIDAIGAKINNKTSYGIRRCKEIMCENEAFSTDADGCVEELESLTVEGLYEMYKKLLETSCVEMIYTGAAPRGEILSLAGEKLAFGSRSARIPKTKVISKVETTRNIIENMDVNQCKFSIGMRMGTTLNDPDYINFSLFNEVLGGSPMSKLFVNVREKKSLCYYCRPIPESIKGVMVIASGIDAKNKEVAYEAIMEQIEETKNANITDEEFEDAKKSLSNGYREIGDSSAQMNAWFLTRITAGRTDTPEESAARLENVTKEDISDAAKKLVLDTVYSLEPQA